MMRVIIRGLVDGALSSLGVVIGASLAGSTVIALSAGLSGATANGFSNILAAFTAEKTHDYMELRKLEKKMLKSLKGSSSEKRINRDVLKRGALDGLFSVIGGVIPVVPFLFWEVQTALYISVIVVTLLAAGLGIYTSIISKDSMLWSVVKLVGFTLITAGICSLIQYAFL